MKRYLNFNDQYQYAGGSCPFSGLPPCTRKPGWVLDASAELRLSNPLLSVVPDGARSSSAATSCASACIFAGDIGAAPPPAAAAAAASLGLCPRLDGTDPCRASACCVARGCCAPSGSAGGGDTRRVGTSGVVHPGAAPRESGSGSALVELSRVVPWAVAGGAASLGRPEYTCPGWPYRKNCDVSLIGRWACAVRARLWRTQMTSPRSARTSPKKPPTTPPTMAPTCVLVVLSCTGAIVGDDVGGDMEDAGAAVVVVTTDDGVVEAGRVDGPWLAAAPTPVRIRVGVGWSYILFCVKYGAAMRWKDVQLVSQKRLLPLI